MKIYTLTTVTEDYGITTTVHDTERKARQCLIDNFLSDEPDVDLTPEDDVIEYAYDRAYVLASITEHEV